jgi:DNA-binding MarR family transcriptional regulator
MRDQLVSEIQRLYPQIYLACHVDHVRARSTEWRLSARDSSLLAHLDRRSGTSPKALATHLGVASSTLSAAIARLVELGYISSHAATADKRQRELRLTRLGAEAMAATSVLDQTRVASLVAKLSPTERKIVAQGLGLLAQAARQLKKRS